jgi:hypothetical protein
MSSRDDKTTPSNGNWIEWSRYVREGIGRIEHDLEGTKRDLYNIVNRLSIDIAVLKVKVAFWGFIGAALATGLVNVFLYFLKAK